MRIISVVNQKGGCGKTTTAVNLAHALARQKRRILLIDLDPQAHATCSLGIRPKLTTADLFEAMVNNRTFNLDDYLILRGENFSVLASSIGLGAVEHSLFGQKDKLEILSNFLKNDALAFDYCIIDSPPNLGNLTLNALVASSYAIVPIGVCTLSLKGVENLNNILNIIFEHKRKVPHLFYLLTQFDKRLRFSQSFLNKVKEQFGKQLLPIVIRTNVHLREAAAQGMSIFEYKNDSRGAQDYKQLAAEIEGAISNHSFIHFFLKGAHLNEVYVVGDFNNWQRDKNYRMKKSGQDSFSIMLPLKRGTHRYKFIADNQWINDPENSLQENDAFGGKNSLVFVR